VGWRSSVPVIRRTALILARCTRVPVLKLNITTADPENKKEWRLTQRADLENKRGMAFFFPLFC
jgi:hypothetical protein